jgi:hypothetical protein
MPTASIHVVKDSFCDGKVIQWKVVCWIVCKLSLQRQIGTGLYFFCRAWTSAHQNHHHRYRSNLIHCDEVIDAIFLSDCSPAGRGKDGHRATCLFTATRNDAIDWLDLLLLAKNVKVATAATVAATMRRLT